MKLKIFFLFIVILQITPTWQSIYDRDRAEEYVGCYKEDIDNRVFSHASGDYRVNELSPVQCMVVCGRRYRYAAVQNGKFCMCADQLPPDKTSEADCPTICPGTLNYPSGETKPKCGGLNTISVYTIKNRILGMNILNPGPVRVFEMTSFGASITNGLDSTFTFDFGDGDATKPLLSRTPNISHVYDRPGQYELILEARNNISGMQEAKKALSVVDDLTDVVITCPSATVIGRPVECKGTMSRGSRINAKIDFGDGSTEHLFLNGKYSHVGRKIPSFKPLTTSKRTTAATFVIPSSEFEEAETITHFELDASVAGAINLQESIKPSVLIHRPRMLGLYFQDLGPYIFLYNTKPVFRPTCSTGEQFCQKNHACISASVTCEKESQFTCGTNEIYCMHRGSCVPKTYINSSSCPAKRPFHFSSAPADYTVVYQYPANITNPGHHVLQLKDAEMFTAMSGDVLGYAFEAKSNSGQVSYASVPSKSDDAPEYQFKTAAQVGQKLLRADAAISNSHHIISAHFNRKAHFSLHHIYNDTGAYYLTTNVSETVVIYVDIAISGVQLVCPTLISTNSSFDINIPAHNGTNTTYEWSTGDRGVINRTKVGLFSYKYTKPGVYSFSLSAFNSLGRVTNFCIIKALDKVANLKFVQAVGAVALGTETVISWTVEFGTNVTYTLDLGDGSAKKSFNMNGKLGNSMEFKYKFMNVGKYNIMIKANNLIGPKLEITDEAVVQIPLKGIWFVTSLPHVTNNVFVAKDDKVELKVSLDQGSSPMCVYRFGDGSAKVITTTLSQKHKYTKLGEWVANVTCMNQISLVNASLNATIVVQELQEIKGLKLNAVPAPFGNATKISIEMQSGSVMFCDWSFGDGTFLKTDSKMHSKSTSHKYNSIRDYMIKVTCNNRLGSQQANITVPVEVPIAGLEVKCPVKYLRVGQPFEVSFTTKTGSRVQAIVDLGEKITMKNVPHTSNKTSLVTHSYTKPGYYTVQVTVKNKYNTIQYKCPNIVKIEYPVSGVRIVTNSPLKFNPGIVEYSWFPSPGFVAPTDAMVSWDYGDGNMINKVPVDFTNMSSTIGTYRYNTTGVFITKMKIENNVSFIKFDLEIDVQKMLPVMLKIVNKNMAPGYGANNDFFALESELALTVTKQSKDKWYYFDFGDGKTLNTTSSDISYKYTKPGKFNVSVIIENVLQRSIKWKAITMQESIMALKLKAASTVHLGTNAIFTILATRIGSSSACYMLNLGDNNMTVFNNSKCEGLVKYSIYNYKFEQLPDKTFTYNHTYKSKGAYNVTLEGRNVVSFAKAKKDITVIYKPCALPTVLVSGAGTLGSPLNSLRSDRIILRANVSFDCDKASHVLFTWTIFKVASSNKLDESNRLNFTTTKHAMPFVRSSGTVDPTIYQIGEKRLPLGINMVKLMITFESKSHDVSDVIGSNAVWLNTQATPLKAIVKGGFKRAVGYEMKMKLDGSQSYDPDFSKTDITGLLFEWYCRRVGESFPSDYQTSNNGAGCFKNGKYNLSDPATSSAFAELYTGTLIQLQSYVLRLVVKKDNRISFFDQEIKVLPGQPPSMDIKCKMNCLEKLNPAERLILESVCTDCKPTTKLTYRWSLLAKNSANLETEVAGFAAKTTTGISQANVALKENVLDAGKEYSLKISAWKPGGETDGVGYSEYRFKVNRPPHSGVCKVSPRSGFSLTTKFQIYCDSWIDEDSPLSYQIDVLRGGNVANLYNGLEQKVETVLPIGEASLNHEMDIIAMVSDKYGYATKTYLKVQVKEPPSVDMGAVSDDLSKLSESGNVQALTQQAVAAGSVMNKGSKGNSTGGNETASKEAVEARTKILLAVSKVTVCDLSQIRQMGDVYNEMTGKPDEVSQDAQDASSSAMDGMSDCMLKSNPQDPGVKAAALTMMQGSAKLLQANMIRAGNNVTSNATANSTVDSAVANASAKVLDTVSKVGGSLLRQLVAGDKPTKMALPNMDMEMSQVAEDADEDDAGFKLPSMTSLMGNQTSDGTKKSVGAMVSSMANSPYGSDSSSADIKSNVMGLALSDADGNPIDLAGQELQMFVKRDASNDIAAEMNQFSDAGTMRFHKFNYSTLENAVAFEVRPLDSKVKIRLFIDYGRRPSVTRFLRNHTFLSREEGAKQKSKLPDPFTNVISNGELNRTGEYYVGLKPLNKNEIYSKFGYVPVLNYTLRIFETKCKTWDDDLKIWSSNGCKVGKKTTFNSTQCVCKFESEQAVSESGVPIPTTYPPTTTNPPTTTTLARTTTAAQAGSSGAQSGSTAGQTAIQPVRKVRKVVKRASFAGGFFVAPNPIDFDKAFAGFANLAENPVAFSTVLSILGVYLIMLFWARREDRKDLLKAGVSPLEDNEPSDRQFYEITVFTGFGNSAATTSNVFIQLSGEDGSSEPRELKDPHKATFRKRGQDVFLASCEDFLGDLTYIRIWHDNSGKSPAWYMSKVAIHDLNTNKKYLFINEAWLAVEEGDGSVEKVLPVAGPEEIASFNHLFYSTTQKNLTDSHIWFSVFIRPPKSRFTRVQRLSCCLTLIYCTMLTNAMFYEIGGSSDPSTTLKLGPFEFSPAQIGIGVMSSLVIFPVNLLIVGVFRSVGPKPSKEELSKKKAKRMWWLWELLFCFDRKKSQSEFMDIITTVPDSETDLKKKAASKPKYQASFENELESGDIGLKIDNDDKKQKLDAKKKKKKPKRKLPYWMKYFAWMLLVLTSFTAAFFVVLYGFQFGKDKSAQWISSMMISFVQDVFVSQPIKILLLGLFVALIVKKPAEEEEEDNKKKSDEEFLNATTGDGDGEERRKRPKGIITFQPPSKEKIQSARELRLKEIKMYGIVKDILIYAVFVVALCQVSYSHLDPKSYMVRKGLEDTLVSGSYGGDTAFSDINSREAFWSWLKTTAVNGLFSTTWYNGDPNIPGFTQDLYSSLFGGARIRQLRVKPGTCQLPEIVKSVSKPCNDWYSWDNEDTKQYDPNWKPLKNSSLYNPPASYRSWEYQTSSELDTYPFVGSMAMYSGGGYVGDLGKYPAKANKLIDELIKHTWVDSRTRAVFLEATVYNAQVNLFAIMNYVVEFLPTNGVEHYYSIKIARLYTYGGSTESFTIACQFFVLLFLFLFVYRESKKIYKEKKKYFKEFWNWVELLMIILVLSTISIFFSRLMLVNSAVGRIKANPGQFTSFNKVAKWDDMFQCVLSFLVMISCIKSIRLLWFSKTISLLSATLKGSLQPLSAFSMVFLIFFLAYVILGFTLFVNHMEDFKSFITAIESTLGVLLGSFDFEAIRDAQPIIGPVYFITIMLFGVMYILNVFMTIIMDVYASVKSELSMKSNEYEIVDFMIGRFKRFVGIQPSGQNKAEAAEKPTEVEDTKLGGQAKEHRKLHRKNEHWKKFLENDDEITKKFNQLDKSLSGFCKDDFAEDKFVDGIIKQGCGNQEGASGMRNAMNFDQYTAEAEYQQDLYEELNKWT